MPLRGADSLAYHPAEFTPVRPRKDSMATAPGPNDLTRQQLDELDALLQRMLGLPLDPPAPPPKPAPLPAPPLPDLPPGWRLDGGRLRAADPHVADLVPAPVALAAVGVAEPPRRPTVVVDDDPAVRFDPSADGTGRPAGGFRTVRGADAPALPAGFMPSVYVEPEPEPEPVPPSAPVRLSPLTPDPLPLSLYPLFAVNWVLETACGLCGPAGAAAVSPAGKHLLGVVGVGLLIGAAAWTARGLGLVDFPVPARPAWWK